MATKPAQICQLQKGKLIDTQKGFVDTFNWVAQSVANLDGGENCKVSWPTDDHPTIDCTAKEGEGGGSFEGSVDAVYDVLSAVDENDVSGLTIQYTDDREDKFIPFPSLSGGNDERNSLPGPFEMDLQLSSNKAKFTNCVMRIARAYFFYDDLTCTVPRRDSIIYVVAQHKDNPTISVGVGDYATVRQNLSSSWSNMLSTTVTPLYRTLSGDVKCDYRYMMNIQAYDSRNYSTGM